MARNQRIVFEHLAGPYAGLRQIAGHTDQFKGQPAPSSAGPFELLGRPGLFSALAKSQPRFLLYRETTAPQTYPMPPHDPDWSILR